MKTKHNTIGALALSAIALTGLALSAPAGAAPAKAVKIYILSGQSNMTGRGGLPPFAEATDGFAGYWLLATSSFPSPATPFLLRVPDSGFRIPLFPSYFLLPFLPLPSFRLPPSYFCLPTFPFPSFAFALAAASAIASLTIRSSAASASGTRPCLRYVSITTLTVSA